MACECSSVQTLVNVVDTEIQGTCECNHLKGLVNAIGHQTKHIGLGRILSMLLWRVTGMVQTYCLYILISL